MARKSARRIPFLPLTLGSIVGALAGVGYARFLRPWMLRWGAWEDELRLFLPGDELLPAPRLSSTHAITIHTPPYRLWPWLVQMGQGRGGFYTYDWIENLMGLQIHSADRVLAMYQDLKVGDTIPLAPGGFGLKVVYMEENRALVLHGDTRQDFASAQVGRSEDAAGAPTGSGMPMRPGDFLAASWGFYIFETESGSTRLVERWKADWNGSLSNTLFYRAFLEPGAFIMQRGMLLGIKERAEGHTVWATAGSEIPAKDGGAAGLELGARPAHQPGDDQDEPFVSE